MDLKISGWKNARCGILKVSCKGGYKELLLYIIEGTTEDELMQNWMTERMDGN